MKLNSQTSSYHSTFPTVRALDQTASHEEILWKAFKQGDKIAFGHLYELHYRPLYGYGYKLLADPASVEDAIQNVFIQLWRSRETLCEVRQVKFYLFRALRREIARLSEKMKRFEHMDQKQVVSDYDDYFFVQQEQEKLLTKKITSMLLTLPERQLEVIKLRFFENFKNEEIAIIMGISEKTVRNTLYKALTHLRENTQDLVPFVELLFLLPLLGKLF